MNVVEVVVATLFGLLGFRSLVFWLRRPFGSGARRDHVLYALFVASRAGLWFALMGLFLLYSTVSTRGRAFIDDVGRFRWYFFVIVVPAVGQFLAGYLLGREPGRRAGDESGTRGPT